MLCAEADTRWLHVHRCTQALERERDQALAKLRAVTESKQKQLTTFAQEMCARALLLLLRCRGACMSVFRCDQTVTVSGLWRWQGCVAGGAREALCCALTAVAAERAACAWAAGRGGLW
jgi:hypothetical protein